MPSNSERGTISRNGLWRESLEIVSPDGAIDADLYDFKVRIWPSNVSGYPRCCNWWWNPYPWGLSADTTDAARAVFQSSDRGGVLTWEFPASETERLASGAYAGAVTAKLRSDPSHITELATFRRVVVA